MTYVVDMQPDVRSALRECIRFVADGGWRKAAHLDGDGKRCLIGMLRIATTGGYDYETALNAVALAIQNYWSVPPSMEGRARHIVTNWNDAPGRTPEQVAGVLAWALEYVENHS